MTARSSVRLFTLGASISGRPNARRAGLLRRARSPRAAGHRPDILVLAFSTLAPDEQREVVERIAEVHARREAGEMWDTARFISSLRAVADYIGHAP